MRGQRTVKTGLRRDVGTAVGAVREFGEALASGPFRVALALSVLLHVGLFLGLRGMTAAPSRRPPVRIHFVREIPVPPAASLPAQPANEPNAGTVAARGVATATSMPAPPGMPTPTPEATPAAPPPGASAPVPVVPAPQAVEPVPEPPEPQGERREEQAPRPAVKSEAASEVPLEHRVADATPAAAAPRGESSAAVMPGGTSGAAAADAAAASEVSGEGGAASADVGSPAAAADAGSHAGAGTGGAAVNVENVGKDGRGMSSAGAGGAAGAVSGPSAQDIADVRRRIDARKVYPQIAIRNGWEGRVLIELHLDLEGNLAKVRLVASSGYSILDEATETAVKLASPFPPIARVVTVPVEYRLIP